MEGYAGCELLYWWELIEEDCEKQNLPIYCYT
jgi:hypothetical protein